MDFDPSLLICINVDPPLISVSCFLMPKSIYFFETIMLGKNKVINNEEKVNLRQ